MGSADSKLFAIDSKLEETEYKIKLNNEYDSKQLYSTEEIYDKLKKTIIGYGKKYFKGITLHDWLDLYKYAISKWHLYHTKDTENIKLVIKESLLTGKGYDNSNDGIYIAYDYIENLLQYVKILKYIVINFFKITHIKPKKVNIINEGPSKTVKLLEIYNKDIILLNFDLLQHDLFENNIIYLSEILKLLKYYQKSLENILFYIPSAFDYTQPT